MTDRDVPHEDPADPYLRARQTFPTLSVEHIERICGFGEELELEGGTVLFRRGERRVPFFLILEGSVEILDHTDEEPSVITVHGKNQFTGELDLFNNKKILVSGRTAGPSRVVRLERPAFQRMMMAEPAIAELITRAFILRRVGLVSHTQGGVALMGTPQDGETLELERFLSRNGYPFRRFDPQDPDAPALPPGCQLPCLVLPDGRALSRPGRAQAAEELGLSEPLQPGHTHDVAVVGAGPAGLAAAVYAASEGLDTVVVEGMAPGGQAGTSSRIENYLGFPTGISGQALAGRAQIQAEKFGARLVIARAATGLDCRDGRFAIALDDGQELLARSVVVATGATYRTLALPNYERFERRGIHYAATAIEADVCRGGEVAVVGGGNSAGQAAVFLSRYARRVHVLVRSDSLAASMSDYLIRRLEVAQNIELHFHTEVRELRGEEYLEEIVWQRRGEALQVVPVANIFVMIGARPNTSWLSGCVSLDAKGFIETSSAGEVLFEASRPGIVAVGDVRAGSVKRVASAVGEGSIVISALHRYLAGLPDGARR